VARDHYAIIRRKRRKERLWELFIFNLYVADSI
jgi:hypothetical protein